MSGRRFRRAAAAAALGLGAVLAALAVLYGEDVPVWSIPLLAAAVLILCELVSLSAARRRTRRSSDRLSPPSWWGACSSLRCSRSPARPSPSWRPPSPPDTASPPGSSAPQPRRRCSSSSRRSRGGPAKFRKPSRALCRTRTGDPLLTIQVPGKEARARAGLRRHEALQTDGLRRRDVTYGGRPWSRWCSRHVRTTVLTERPGSSGGRMPSSCSDRRRVHPRSALNAAGACVGKRTRSGRSGCSLRQRCELNQG